MTGRDFERLKVLGQAREKTGKHYYWICECTCVRKKIIQVRGDNLKNGNVKSCGCLREERRAEKAKENIVEGTNVGRILSEKIPKSNSSGIRGVTLYTKTGKWAAYIAVNRKQYHLGYFDTIEEARKARKITEEKYYKSIIEKYKNAKS